MEISLIAEASWVACEYKFLKQLQYWWQLKFTKNALVDMYLTTGGVKIRALGYTPEIFSPRPHSALQGLTFHTVQW